MRRRLTLLAVSLLLGLVGLSGGFSASLMQHNADSAPRAALASALAETEPPVVEAFAIEGDSIPVTSTGLITITASNLSLYFGSPPQGNSSSRFLFISANLLDQLKNGANPTLKEQLWTLVLKQGHGLFVSDVTSEQIAEALELRIPTATMESDGDYDFLGTALIRYPDLQQATDCEYDPAFAATSVFSSVMILDDENNESYGGPGYDLVHSMMRMVAQSVLDEAGSPFGPNATTTGLARSAGSHQRAVFVDWRDDNNNFIDCLWGSVYTRTAAFVAASPGMDSCNPPGTWPSTRTWTAAHSVSALGSASRWRLRRNGTADDIFNFCLNHDNMLLWDMVDQPFKGGGDGQLPPVPILLDARPMNSVGAPSNQSYTLGVSAGPSPAIYGEVSSAWNTQTTDVVSQHALGGAAAAWTFEFPPYNDPCTISHFYDYRGSEAHRAFGAIPATKWETFGAPTNVLIIGTGGYTKARMRRNEWISVAGCGVREFPKFDYKWIALANGSAEPLPPCPPPKIIGPQPHSCLTATPTQGATNTPGTNVDPTPTPTRFP